jgi:hypothetical protein
MILQEDSCSDFDLSNVKPPNGISALPLSSILLFLKFSKLPGPPERSHNHLEEGSPNFEDLLGPEHVHHIPNPNLEIPNWQYDEVEHLENREGTLAQLSNHPAPPLHQLDTPEIQEHFLHSDSRLPCLPCSSFQSLETDLKVFSRQTSNLACRLDQGMALSDEQSSVQPNEIDTTASSSSLSTFEPLERERSGRFRSPGKGIVCSPSFPVIRTPLSAQQSTAFYQPILGLIDAAFRTFIHPQPTRLSAGIKFSATSFGSNPSGQDNLTLTALSDLAPSIFTPGYAQGVVERAPLVPSIAKSLATFLRYRSRSEADKGASAEPRGRSEDGEGEGEEEVQGDVNAILRGHLWMTMTNGLRVSRSANARRLQPLAMPCAWREHSRDEDDLILTREEDVEMLDGHFGPRQKLPSRGYEQAEEDILEGLDGELVCGEEDSFEGGLLLDNERIDGSFLTEEFEDLCLFGRDVDIDVSEGGGMDDVEVGGEIGCGYYAEEMLF